MRFDGATARRIMDGQITAAIRPHKPARMRVPLQRPRHRQEMTPEQQRRADDGTGGQLATTLGYLVLTERPTLTTYGSELVTAELARQCGYAGADALGLLMQAIADDHDGHYPANRACWVIRFQLDREHRERYMSAAPPNPLRGQGDYVHSAAMALDPDAAVVDPADLAPHWRRDAEARQEATKDARDEARRLARQMRAA